MEEVEEEDTVQIPPALPLVGVPVSLLRKIKLRYMQWLVLPVRYKSIISDSAIV